MEAVRSLVRPLPCAAASRESAGSGSTLSIPRKLFDMLSINELRRFGSEDRPGSIDAGTRRESSTTDFDGDSREGVIDGRSLSSSLSVDEDGILGDEMGRYDGRLGSKWSFLKTLKEKKAEERDNPTTVVNIVHSELVSSYTICKYNILIHVGRI